MGYFWGVAFILPRQSKTKETPTPFPACSLAGEWKTLCQTKAEQNTNKALLLPQLPVTQQRQLSLLGGTWMPAGSAMCPTASGKLWPSQGGLLRCFTCSDHGGQCCGVHTVADHSSPGTRLGGSGLSVRKLWLRSECKMGWDVGAVGKLLAGMPTSHSRGLGSSPGSQLPANVLPGGSGGWHKQVPLPA